MTRNLVKSDIISDQNSLQGEISLLKRQVNRYKETTQQYEDFVRNTNDRILVINQGRIISASKGFLAKTGYIDNELIGKSLLQFIAKTSRKRIQGFQYLQWKNETNTDHFEIKIVLKNRSVIPVKVKSSIIDFQGKRCTLLGITESTISRKQLILPTKSSTEQWSIAEDAIILTNKNDQIIHWNKAAEKMFGYSEQEVLGMVLQKLISTKNGSGKNQEKPVRHQNHKIISRYAPYIRSGRKKNGKEFPIEYSASPFEINNNWYSAVLISPHLTKGIIDREQITDQKSKRERSSKTSYSSILSELLGSRHFLAPLKTISNNFIFLYELIKQLTFRTSHRNTVQTRIEKIIRKKSEYFIKTSIVPILGIDTAGKINEWNHSIEKITGFSKNEVLGKKFTETFIAQDHQKYLEKILNKALLDQKTGNFEFPIFRLITKNGRKAIVPLNSSILKNDQGDITGLLVVGQDITEIEELRTETQAVAKELRQFIETANAPIFGIDANGQVNEWNQTAEKITGFSKNEMLGKDLVETYITEDYRQSVKKVLDDALRGQETANYEFPLFTKDGHRVMVLLNSSTRRNAQGNIVGVLGVGQDITEIDKLRTETEAVAKELRQFIETANAPIFGIDANGQVNEWNQTAEKITGFSKNEVLGKDLVETYITEDYRQSVKKVLDDALRGQETANYEFPLFTKVGHRVMVLLNSSTRRDAQGNIVGVLGVGQDITEIDKLRTETEAVAKELRQFIETANAPIFGIDANGQVNEWNQTAEKITGFSKNEVLGKDLVETYITEDYRQSVKKVLVDALRGQETANYEFPLFTKDGHRVMVLLNSSTRRNAQGNIVGVLGVGQDITELDEYRNELEVKVNERTKELNEALKKEKELSEMKSRFVSMASHEFRTPLSAINFSAGIIKKYWEKLEPQSREKRLDKIEDQVRHMTNLLDDVLVVGKAEAGKITFRPSCMNFNEFIDPIVEEVYTSTGKTHKIIVENKNSDSFIFTDEKLGRNIFINLLTNAIKFSPGQQEVRLVINDLKESTELKIIDFGLGIKEEDYENIFIPFQRGENVETIQGTGLGLSIVKAAIEAHQGKIEIESTLGQGSIFTVHLPKTISE